MSGKSGGMSKTKESTVREYLKNFLSNSKNQELIDKYHNIRVENTDDMWDCTLPQNKKSLQKELKECKILILTANDVERTIVTQMLYSENNQEKLKSCIIDGIYITKGTIAGCPTAHYAQYSAGSSLDGGSIEALLDAFSYFKPTLVVSLGVAYGINPKEQNFGDVIVSTKIVDIDKYNKISEDGYKQKPENLYECDHDLIAACRILTPNIPTHFGTIITKGSVIDYGKEKEKLVEGARSIGVSDAVGGEMEGSGLAQISTFFAKKKTHFKWAVIKGICDWGEDKNALDGILCDVGLEKRFGKNSNDYVKDAIQAYAAENAFNVLKYFLNHVGYTLVGDSNKSGESSNESDPPPKKKQPSRTPIKNESKEKFSPWIWWKLNSYALIFYLVASETLLLFYFLLSKGDVVTYHSFDNFRNGLILTLLSSLTAQFVYQYFNKDHNSWRQNLLSGYMYILSFLITNPLFTDEQQWQFAENFHRNLFFYCCMLGQIFIPLMGVAILMALKKRRLRHMYSHTSTISDAENPFRIV